MKWSKSTAAGPSRAGRRKTSARPRAPGPRPGALGRHLLIELYGCAPSTLGDVAAVQKSMVAAAKAARAVILDVVFHAFAPSGVSGVVVIAQSHLAVHTWPEHDFASVDVYTCGSHMDPWRALPTLKRRFKARRTTAVEIPRGVLPLSRPGAGSY